jgi:hypothetical protein
MKKYNFSSYKFNNNTKFTMLEEKENHNEDYEHSLSPEDFDFRDYEDDSYDSLDDK